MTREEAIKQLDTMWKMLTSAYDDIADSHVAAYTMAVDALKAQGTCEDAVSRADAFNAINDYVNTVGVLDGYTDTQEVLRIVKRLPSAQPNLGKYEYHYDHTDCIWYRPEARNRCPVTCAQYRDGWNDAMNYIFRDGKGYMPYRRDKQYGE